jgi:hypothetical protein
MMLPAYTPLPFEKGRYRGIFYKNDKRDNGLYFVALIESRLV